MTIWIDLLKNPRKSVILQSTACSRRTVLCKSIYADGT